MKTFDLFTIREYFPSIENPSPSSWVFNQAKELQNYGINPLVISPTPEVPVLLNKIVPSKHAWKIKPSSYITNYLGVNVLRPSYIKLPNKYFINYNIKKTSTCIVKATKEIKAKLIHAHFGHTGVASLRLKRYKKLPLITSFYGYDLGSDKKQLAKHYKRLSSEGELFLVLSEDMKMDLINLGFPEKKIKIHHLGVDTEHFRPNNSIKTKDGVVFTIVATFEERKGIHHAIHAFKEYLNTTNRVQDQLRIVGDGYFYKKLKKIANNNEQIVFINNFIAPNPRQIIFEEMNYCDIFLLPSLKLPNGDKEGTPIVLMEAQACGKPCISTYHAGIPEEVIDGKTGILVKEGNISELKDAMILLAQDSQMRKEMGKNARDHIKINFNNNLQNEKLAKIYNSYL